MPRIEDGGPAFPRPSSEDRTQGDQPDGNHTVSEQEGMSLRDHFAAAALPAVLSAVREFPSPHNRPVLRRLAHTAYRIADEMLAARKYQNEDLAE